MKKFRKRINSLVNKLLSFMMIVSVFFGTFNFSFIMPVSAGELGQELTMPGGIANGDYIEFYEGENLMAQVQIKIGEDVLTPIGNKVVLPEFEENYQVGFYITYEDGYEASSYSVNGNNYLTPGGGATPYVSITSSADLTVSFDFQRINNNPGPGPGDDGPLPSMVNYPILAYFQGIVEPVESTPENMILIPNEWTSGTVSFKAKICMIGEETRPDDGVTECDPETQILSDLNIQGISNGDQINRTVSGYDDQNILIDEGFLNYGKVGIHLTNEILNITTDVISQNLINVEAMAPMRMDYSYGLSTIDQAIVTNNTSGNLSIFFGNEESTLIATGPNVVGITSLTGADYILNDEDKSVTVSLPPLSKETTTSVSITIELSDNSTVTRQINIMRTAIELSYEGESKTIRAGYVMHKAYLYNNQPHDDNVFNAYLQVIIYRNDVVVGYRQVQIDDEEFVNNLGENESGSMESVNPESLVIYDGGIEGANKVSVFLTNGPIDYNSDILPSIEFGLGAGVQIEWEE